MTIWNQESQPTEVHFEQRHLDQAEETVQSWSQLTQDPEARAELADTTLEDVMPELNEALSKLWFCTAGLSANHTAHLAAVDLFSKAVNESNRGKAFGAAMCMTACSESWTAACTLAEAKSLSVIRTLVALTESTDERRPTLDAGTTRRLEEAKTAAKGFLAFAERCREKEQADIDGSREQISALR
jgi:hypothetical protein